MISYVFISEAWQPALVADDLSWRATLDDPALSEESIIPERQLHAAWRRLLVALPSPEPSSPGSGFADAALRTALSDARRAIGRDAALATARMLVAVDRPAAAEALLEAAIEVDPAEQVLVLLGSLIGNRGTPEALDRAAALFLRAAERAPGSAEPWVRLGVTRAKQGRAADARDAWQRALAIDPARRDAAEFLRRLRAE